MECPKCKTPIENGLALSKRAVPGLKFLVDRELSCTHCGTKLSAIQPTTHYVAFASAIATLILFGVADRMNRYGSEAVPYSLWGIIGLFITVSLVAAYLGRNEKSKLVPETPTIASREMAMFYVGVAMAVGTLAYIFVRYVM